ncbi:hypothetical protein BN77_3642 [Rhizobium mesoamericanum STM3625]|uniref:Uncharacterized protein n=1 Tax=Rhizobium mesoamericanum STM3625 TaxID=1211777 RepID=K0Q2B4_9HYPH|nr:hypothetical protein BN77_3642 [Rhizobium mesoamericanum STM3625]
MTGGGASVGAAVLSARPRAFPHFGQNAKSGWHGAPQEAHVTGCLAPHFGQNAKPLSIKKPQAPQFIGLPLERLPPLIWS